MATAQAENHVEAGALAQMRGTAHARDAWTIRFARFFRWLHKWVGALLALLMVTLSITGIFVAFKNEVEYLQPAQRTGAPGNIADAISPARVADIVLALPSCRRPPHSDRSTASNCAHPAGCTRCAWCRAAPGPRRGRFRSMP